MGFKNKIWVNHAAFTSPVKLNKDIKKRVTHMQLKMRVDGLPGGEILDAIKDITTREKELIEKASIVVVFSVGPKTWTVRVSMPEYMYMTQEYIDAEGDEALIMGCDLMRMPDRVVTDGFIVTKDEALELLKMCDAGDRLSFNVAETMTKVYKRS